MNQNITETTITKTFKTYEHKFRVGFEKSDQAQQKPLKNKQKKLKLNKKKIIKMNDIIIKIK